ncbi:MAG: MarR family winged helix-turn-helix transcriptional regulator [Acidobacteriia bacterium]|nr:MarR family winged helix-turn-helix transcriptional regulator [Terriglobia bacterium]
MKRSTKRRATHPPRDHHARISGLAIDFTKYVPAHVTYLANKISSGATAIYLPRFGVGITEWRIMALLGREAWVTPKRVSDATGLDKGAVSRSIHSMRAAGIVEVRPDQYDRRSQILALTAKGLRLHDRMVKLAHKREQILLGGFSKKERSLLVQFLARIESQVPAANSVAEDEETDD